MNYKIAVIKGDGIGPEIVEASMKVLDKIGEKYNHTFDYTEVLAGGAAIDACDTPLPQKTVDICKASDAVLLGALGGPKWDNLPGDVYKRQTVDMYILSASFYTMTELYTKRRFFYIKNYS